MNVYSDFVCNDDSDDGLAYMHHANGKRRSMSSSRRSSSTLSSETSLMNSMDLESLCDLDDDKEKEKRKTRNLSEKKRRDQFNMLITELCGMVSSSHRKMDKTAVLKTAIAFLKSHYELTEKSLAHEIKEDWKPPFLSNNEFAQLMLEAVDGFMLVMTQDGCILYMSETVTSLLKYLPLEMVNTSIFEYIHADERNKVYELIANHRPVPGSHQIPDYEKAENQLTFTCHLRCRRESSQKGPLYEHVECRGGFRRLNRSSEFFSHMNIDACRIAGSDICYFCTVRLKSPHITREITVMDETGREFISKHSLEWKFLYLDHRGPPIIGYLPFEVLGTSGYEYYHPEDLERVGNGHQELIQTGEGVSCFYRFLTKGQQWIWLRTRYYITYHQFSSEPELIVCTHTVVSYVTVTELQQQELQHERGFTSETAESEEQVIGSLNETADPISSSLWMGDSPSHCVGNTPPITETKCEVGVDSIEQRRTSLDMQQQNSLLHEVHSSADNRSLQPTLSSPHLMTSQRLDPPPPLHTDTQQLLPPSSADCMAQSYLPAGQQTMTQQMTSTYPGSQMSITSGPDQQQQPCAIPHRMHPQPVQAPMQEHLREKHERLRNLIINQQSELRRIQEQIVVPSPLDPNPPPHSGGAMMVGSSPVQQLSPDSPALHSCHLSPQSNACNAVQPPLSGYGMSFMNVPYYSHPQGVIVRGSPPISSSVQQPEGP